MDCTLHTGPRWCREFIHEGTLDNQLWHQAMITNRDQEIHRAGRVDNDNSNVLWVLLNWGTIDNREIDRPWDGSVRSMRYTSAVSNRLWTLLEVERERVCLSP